jgi:hypothetical protein
VKQLLATGLIAFRNHLYSAISLIGGSAMKTKLLGLFGGPPPKPNTLHVAVNKRSKTHTIAHQIDPSPHRTKTDAAEPLGCP